MKSFLKTSFIVTALVGAGLPAMRAADTPTPAPTATPAASAPAHRRVGPLGRLMLRHRVVKQLGLSADQISQLKANRATAAQNVKAVRADTSLTPEQKRARVREIVANARTQMHSVLTPEQQAKLQEMRQRAGKARGL